jgi:hypothetical protein
MNKNNAEHDAGRRISAFRGPAIRGPMRPLAAGTPTGGIVMAAVLHLFG